jgi:hypothetical protein
LTIGGTLSVQGSDFVIGTNDGRSVGSTTTQRALVHGLNDTLHLNYQGDFEGGTVIGGPTTTVSGSFCVGSACVSTSTWQTMVNNRGEVSVISLLGFNSLLGQAATNLKNHRYEKATYNPISHDLSLSLVYDGYYTPCSTYNFSLSRLERTGLNQFRVKSTLNTPYVPGTLYSERIRWSVVRVGNFLYYGQLGCTSNSYSCWQDPANGVITRCDLNFSDCVDMTIAMNGKKYLDLAFSDGAYLYGVVHNRSNGNKVEWNLSKFEISGNTLTRQDTGLPLSASVSDGTYFYSYDDGSKKISRYDASGAKLKEWTIDGMGDFFFVEGNHFITGSGSYISGDSTTDCWYGGTKTMVTTAGLDFYDLGVVD